MELRNGMHIVYTGMALEPLTGSLRLNSVSQLNPTGHKMPLLFYTVHHIYCQWLDICFSYLSGSKKHTNLIAEKFRNAK